MRRVVIGLTGVLGSGKTTAAGYFKRLGADVIDADKIAHQVLADKGIVKKITSYFGEDVLRNRKIDRKKLAGIVFGDGTKLKKLCGIIHPVVLKRIKKILKKSGKGVVIIDAPLLIESGLHKAMDAVIAVRIKQSAQLKRCLRLGYSEEEALKRIKAQMPQHKKLRYADFIIDNSGSRKEVKKQVLEIWKKYVKGGNKNG